MTLTQLKYMIAVAEAGNFTLAAEKSFVTQPTLSMQIQKLEDELGVQIFNRTKKPIRLTKVGSEILIQARKIISESKRMEDVVAQEKGFIGGSFSLGIICLLYTSDAADDSLRVDLGGRRIIKKVCDMCVP